jgi:hypothetical protein
MLFCLDFPLIFFDFMTQQPPVGHGLLVIQTSRSHSDTLLSVGLIWTVADSRLRPRGALGLAPMFLVLKKFYIYN